MLRCNLHIGTVCTPQSSPLLILLPITDSIWARLIMRSVSEIRIETNDVSWKTMWPDMAAMCWTWHCIAALAFFMSHVCNIDNICRISIKPYLSPMSWSESYEHLQSHSRLNIKCSACTECCPLPQQSPSLTRPECVPLFRNHPSFCATSAHLLPGHR